MSPETSAIEEDDLFGFSHFTRTDASDYFLRSSLPRESYRSASIPPREAGGIIHRGDVMVVNDNLEHYRGEVEVALRDFPDDGTRNIVARVLPDELFLLGYIKPEYPFGFIRS